MLDIRSILVTGGSGQLGQSLKRLIAQHPEYCFTFPNRKQLDLSNEQCIADFFKQQTFDLIINCAAYTAVDNAELKSELANQLNYLAVKQLSEIALKQGSKLIHLSTDYVFAGDSCRPYVETDEVSPQGVYGVSKLKGEEAVQRIMPTNAVIIRTSWVYSEFGNNFVKTMLKLGEQREELNVIFDQVGTPTYAGDLAQAMMHIVQSEAFNQLKFETDIYHFSNEGVCSWYDFAKTIFELRGVECAVNPIETKDYPMPAKRPLYSVLNKAKIKHAYELNVPYWKEALERCLRMLNI